MASSSSSPVAALTGQYDHTLTLFGFSAPTAGQTRLLMTFVDMFSAEFRGSWNTDIEVGPVSEFSAHNGADCRLMRFKYNGVIYMVFVHVNLDCTTYSVSMGKPNGERELVRLEISTNAFNDAAGHKLSDWFVDLVKQDATKSAEQVADECSNSMPLVEAELEGRSETYTYGATHGGAADGWNQWVFPNGTQLRFRPSASEQPYSPFAHVTVEAQMKKTQEQEWQPFITTPLYTKWMLSDIFYVANP